MSLKCKMLVLGWISDSICFLCTFYKETEAAQSGAIGSLGARSHISHLGNLPLQPQ